MLILNSPAKRLDFENDWNSIEATKPKFLDEAEELVANLQKLDKSSLGKILQISDKLAELNFERFQNWSKKHIKSNSKPAILAYQGDVYQKFNAENYSKKKQNYLQNSLRIITGLYGVLKPYDLIQPYRLEMKIKFKTKSAKNLYEFWIEKITDHLNQEIKKDKHKLIVNLASNEYTKAVDVKKFSIPTYTIKFQQKTAKGLKSIMLPVKHARGTMIKYLTENAVNTLDGVRTFNLDGYKLYEEDKSTLTFVKKWK